MIWGGAISRIRLILRRLWNESMNGAEYVRFLRKQGIRIGENVNFRYPSHTLIDTTRPCLVEMGNNIDINDNFTILTHDFGTFVFREYYKDFVNSSGKVKIGNNIVFGRDVTVLKGVTIGNNCIIGAGSIITKSIPDNSVVAGNPAKVICSLDEYYHKRKNRQLGEAIEYGIELAKYKGGVDKLFPSDFTEEWVLFLSEDEYNSNEATRKNVDFRINGLESIKEFLHRPRPFADYESFVDAIRDQMK